MRLSPSIVLGTLAAGAFAADYATQGLFYWTVQGVSHAVAQGFAADPQRFLMLAFGYAFAVSAICTAGAGVLTMATHGAARPLTTGFLTLAIAAGQSALSTMLFYAFA